MRESEKRQAQRRVLDVVRRVRWRWRARLLLRGLVQTVLLTGVVVFLAAFALERARFDADAVLWARVLSWSTLLISLVVFIVRPLRKRVSDAQVALYLEEHEPSLEHTVMSVLEEGSGSASPELAQRVTEVALDRARKVNYGRRVEQSALYRFAGALTVVALLALSGALMGPEHLRFGLGALLFPTTDAATVNPYSVSVMPGDVTIARGSDQMVTAALAGFEAADASVFTKGESET